MRELINDEKAETLRRRLAVHLNNVVDALKIDEFFEKFIIQDEPRF